MSRGARRLDRRKRGRNVERRRERPGEDRRRRGRRSLGIRRGHGRLRARGAERLAGRAASGPSAAPYWEDRALTHQRFSLHCSRSRIARRM
jgi:hypothetical protein